MEKYGKWELMPAKLSDGQSELRVISCGYITFFIEQNDPEILDAIVMMLNRRIPGDEESPAEAQSIFSQEEIKAQQVVRKNPKLFMHGYRNSCGILFLIFLTGITIGLVIAHYFFN